MGQPFDVADELLNKDREVVCPLLRSGDNHDLAIGIDEQGPQHKGSSDPALADSAEGADL